MPEAIMPLDDFLQLNAEEQIEKLKRWKMDYTLKDIREAWNFKHSAQYYMLLKKLRIYERVVNKSDKFYPMQDQLLVQQGGAKERAWRGRSTYAQQDEQPADHFNYQLNTTLTGTELAEKLERLAFFLKGEQKPVQISLTIESAEAGASMEAEETNE
ncbi:hypothetical protein [Paenibacillus glycanilyticus]|uniref:Uncharacterized protein n=1 Tax=Paenibacillus glycanilyticus TaxID=126569 RepID=A0ABQ6NPL1_9BACL|nr:hypothetical protein [Paenibacillus glycanilyticus]GMK46474.1 hypothetical protein PghCCS26_36030 [Paenibacillus glycanilyticus]